MLFYYFNSVRALVGQPCTLEVYRRASEHPQVKALAEQIAATQDAEKRGKLKKLLPVITWQASFRNGTRKNIQAVPSGLFMVDFDHVDEKMDELTCEALSKISELGIVYIGKSISGTGLRVVAECRKEFTTLHECQAWLANQLGQPCDEACKDWARSSFVVPIGYEVYIDESIFSREPSCVYDVNAVPPTSTHVSNAKPRSGETKTADTPSTGIQTHYKGLSLKSIAERWLKESGGMPEQGERNTRLYGLALHLRYITDFSPESMAANMPDCGLPHDEILQLCRSACSAQKSSTIPDKMQTIISRMDEEARREASNEATGTDGVCDAVYIPEPFPPFPPVFKEFVDSAPDDFKSAVALTLLPMLGTLGSRLRANYLGGNVESPSFQVTLEAEQASGKSFISRMQKKAMFPLREKDAEGQEIERQYAEEDENMQFGSTKKDREEYIKRKKERKTPIIRQIGAVASLTKVLKRAQAAQGLHLYAQAAEIDTITKAFGRGFSNLTDFLRCAFDNEEYSQDYASNTSFSGRLPIFYNTLYSGTPGAVGKFFFGSEETGTMSRTLFVTFADQFGMRPPYFRPFTLQEETVVDYKLKELYEVSIIGDEVQEEHWMNLDYLSENLGKWCEEQRLLSVSTNDRVRNTFYRRSAEVGFRAGMLAHFLYGERYGADVETDVCAFSRWVAEKMLQQFLVRIDPETTQRSNVIKDNLLNMLPQQFTRDQLIQVMAQVGKRGRVSQLLCRWAHNGKIEKYPYGATVFKKL